MSTYVYHVRDLLSLIPENILRDIAEIPVIQAGFAAGPGFITGKCWGYNPPVTIPRALTDLERYRNSMRRCHLRFLDGTRLYLDRHKFSSFLPSDDLRTKHTSSSNVCDSF